ncbi:proton-dependent oligopeptide transport family protein, partial [Genlisea aurea]
DMAEDRSSVDWRGRAWNPAKHGGMRAAAFVLGLQGMEIAAIAAVGNNLITYVIGEMHFSLPESANAVTNFVGTVFIVALLGGYVADSYLGCFRTMLVFGFVELSGLVLLSVQAHLPELKPPRCDVVSKHGCEKASGFQAVVFFLALYLVALGSGCVKPNMLAHGADQFDQADEKQWKNLSRYFNAAYFAFSAGELLALTAIVYLQTNSGMDVGFGVSALAMASGLIALICGTRLYRNKPPHRSIFTPIAQVMVAAAIKRKLVNPSDPQLTPRFRFLNKACIKVEEDNKKESPWRLCTAKQVEQVKALISVIPIFASTIIFNTILAQLQTFSVQQGTAMETHLTASFRIPPASIQAIPYLMLILVVPLYDLLLVPFARRFTRHESGISPLHRIGFGLFLVTFSMISAALTEARRRKEAVLEGRVLSIAWITPQFVIFGFSEMFTAVGLVEFFYKQQKSLKGMETFLTAVTYCSYSFGFYFSSVLVSVVNRVTGSGGGGWLAENDLNRDRLDLFYWFLAVLSSINFVNYLFCARWWLNGAR